MKKEIMNTVIKPTLQARYSARKEILENEPLEDTIDHTVSKEILENEPLEGTIDHTVSNENRKVIHEIDKILDEHNSKWGKPNSVKRAMNECVDILKSLYNIIMYLPSVLIWLITLGQLNILSSRPYQTEKIITFASVSNILSFKNRYNSIQKEQKEYEEILNNTEKKEVDTELSEKKLKKLFNKKLETMSPNEAINNFYSELTKPQSNTPIRTVNQGTLRSDTNRTDHTIPQIKKAPRVASNDRTAYPSNTSTKEIKPHK